MYSQHLVPAPKTSQTHSTMKTTTKTKVFLKIASEILRTKAPTSVGELSVAVKAKCAALRIHIVPSDLDDAIGIIARRMPVPPSRVVRQPVRETWTPMGRKETADIWNWLSERGLDMSKLLK